jgi:hypothetical protein
MTLYRNCQKKRKGKKKVELDFQFSWRNLTANKTIRTESDSHLCVVTWTTSSLVQFVGFVPVVF